jgi:hypothetical protein
MDELRRFPDARLREGTRAEFSLTAPAYNMTRVLKIVWIERLLKAFKNAETPAFSTLYSLFAELTENFTFFPRTKCYFNLWAIEFSHGLSRFRNYCLKGG